MLCSVRLIDGTVESVSLPKQATGRCLLQEICSRRHLTAEIDYFGLRYVVEGRAQWINMRNSLRQQLGPGTVGSAVELRVKYFVNHSQLLLAETRRQFFLNMKSNLAEGKYHVTQDKAARIMALLLRCEYGEDALARSSTNQYLLHDWVQNNDARALERLRNEHVQLRGVSSEEAEKLLMCEVEGYELHGAELFTAVSSVGEHVIIAVCRDGIRVYGRDMVPIDEYLYTSDLYASVKCKYFNLEIAEGHQCFGVAYKLPTRQMAQNVYRTTVEFYTFFSEDRVSEWVADAAKKTRRLNSLTNLIQSPKASPNRKYFFDVAKTENEVFEHAWMLIAEEKALELQREIRPSLPPALPKTPKAFGRVFNFSDTPSSPLTSKTNPLSLSGSNVRTPKTAATPGLVFQFGSAPSKLLTAKAPRTPKTPKILGQVFQFNSSPAKPLTAKNNVLNHSGEAIKTPKTPKTLRDVFRFSSTPLTPLAIKNHLLDKSGEANKTPKTPKTFGEVFRFSSTPAKPLTPKNNVLDHPGEVANIPKITISTPAKPLNRLLEHASEANDPQARLASGYLTHERLTTNQTFNGFLSTVSCLNNSNNNNNQEISPSKSEQRKKESSAQEFSRIANELRTAYEAGKQKETLKNAMFCTICNNKWRNAAFLPCGHVVACIGCAVNCRTCSECDTEIKRVTRMNYP